MTFDQFQIIKNGDMTQTLYSIVLDSKFLAIGSIQAVFDGAPNGILKLQISNDFAPTNPTQTITNWSDYTGSQVAVTGSGNWAWNIEPLGFRWLRLAYVPTSGTGTLNAIAVAKGA